MVVQFCSIAVQMLLLGYTLSFKLSCQECLYVAGYVSAVCNVKHVSQTFQFSFMSTENTLSTKATC